MESQIIEVYTTEHVITPHEHTDKFMLRRDGRLVWLQRILFWILRRLRCWAIYDEVTAVRHRIDTRKFAEAIYRQRADLLNLYHYKGERLLIGAEDFRELMGDPEMNQVMSFSGEYFYAEGGHRTILGLEVTIIPWMRGILVLPKELPGSGGKDKP